MWRRRTSDPSRGLAVCAEVKARGQPELARLLAAQHQARRRAAHPRPPTDGLAAKLEAVLSAPAASAEHRPRARPSGKCGPRKGGQLNADAAPFVGAALALGVWAPSLGAGVAVIDDDAVYAQGLEEGPPFALGGSSAANFGTGVFYAQDKVFIEHSQMEDGFVEPSKPDTKGIPHIPGDPMEPPRMEGPESL